MPRSCHRPFRTPPRPDGVSRSAAAVAVVLALAMSALVVAPAAADDDPEVWDLSVDTSGAYLPGDVEGVVAQSADGAVVAFIESDDHYGSEVYVRDTESGVTVRLTSNGDSPAVGYSTAVALSADGERVAFDSTSEDMTGSDGSGVARVYLYDRSTGRTMLVPSADDTGAQQPATAPAISGDGTRLAFTRHDPSGDVIEVVDIAADGTTSTVASIALGTQSDARSALSADGSTLAYYADDAPADADDADLGVHVTDLATRTERKRLGVTFSGRGDPGAPALSADGTVLAYVSTVPAGQTGNASHVLLDRVFVYDVRTDADPSQIPAPEEESELDLPSITADGGTVAATAWLGHDLSTGTPDFDPDGGWVVRLSGGAGVIFDTGSGHRPHTVSVSPDGGAIAFTSGSSDYSQEGQVRAFGTVTPAADVPAFRSDDELEADDVSATSLTLVWPAATGSVASYRLARDGTDLGTTAASTTTLPVTGLQPATEYTFTVVAVGRSGEASAPLTLRVATADDIPPTFPDGARLVLDRLAATSLRVSWPAATDNLELAGYRIAVDGEDVAAVPAATLYDDLDRLIPASSHRIAVRPYDAQGNEGSALMLDVTLRAELVLTKRTSSELDFRWTLPVVGGPATVSPVVGYVFETAASCDDPMGSPREVAADSNVIVLDGLTSDTEFCAQVFARHGDGSTAAWTTPLEVSTAAMAAPSVTFTAPRVLGMGGELEPGGTMMFTLRGETGRTATVTLWQDAVGAGVHADVPLTEGTPGVYTGSYRLDGSINRFYKVVGTLSDGVHQAIGAVDIPPFFVGGDLDLTIEKSIDPLPGMVLHLEAARTWDESLDVPVSDGTTTTLALPYGTYTASLVMPDGDVLATRSDVVIDSGGRTRLELTPVRHTLLHVRLTAPAGVPVGGYTVTATGADGVEVGSRDIPLGSSEAEFTVAMHGTVAVTAHLDDRTRPVRATLSGTIETGPGVSTLTLATSALPTAAVSARVTGSREPLNHATVTVTEHVDERDWTFSATTDSSGAAQIPALAGDARITASGDLRLVSGMDATLAEDEVTNVSFDLLPAPTYRIHPHLFTQQADGAEVEQPLDWRTSVHFDLVLTLGQRGLGVLPEVVTAGSGGDEVRLCANGAQGGLNRGCATATLGADPVVDVALHLSQAGLLAATLAEPSGAAYTGAWSATVYPVAADGALDGRGRTYANGADGRVRLGVPNAGDAILIVTDTQGRSTGPVSLHVAAGADIDLGALTLSPTASRDPAAIVVSPSPALPGQLFGIRVGLPQSAIAAGYALQVSVPAHTTFEPASATVNGTAVVATAADGGGFLIPLPPPATGSSAGIVIRYAVTVDSDAPSGSLDSIVRLRHADGTVTEVGTASTALASVTVAGPRLVAHPTFTVSGTAPAGAEITLYAGSDIAGHATAGAGGHYTATVNYAEPLSGYERAVVATIDGTTLRSAPLYVTYDADAVEPISATVENGIGTTGSTSRAISFDPSAGVASFTQVYVPGTPTKVTLRFADASRISGFSAVVGANSAAGSCSGNVCTATVPTSSATVGDIYVDYDIAPLPAVDMNAVPVPSAEQLRHNLPSVFANATAKDWDPTASTGTFTLPGLGDVEVDVAAEAVPSYTPTPKDVAFQQATGIHAYDTQVSMSGDTLTGSMLLPTAWLNEKVAEVNGGTTVDPLNAGPALRAFALPPITEEALTKIKFTWIMNGSAIIQMGNDISEGLFGFGRFADLNDLDSDIDALMACDARWQMQAHGIVTSARGDVVMYKMFGGMFQTLGMLGGSLAESAGYTGVKALGIDGVLGGIVDNVVGWNADSSVEQAQKEVKAAIQSAHCVGGLHKWETPTIPTKRRLASPTYIFDPSGFAYAGVASDRVEGVTATILTAPSADGPWTEWDAGAFGQTSPQLTDANGQYGWDVPKGYYKVRFSKAGYRTVDSETVQVLPERMDLNVDMLALAAPTVVSIGVDETGATVTFDQWMPVGGAEAGISMSADGRPLAASVEPLDMQQAPDGTPLAKRFRLVLAAPVATGTELTVVVDGTIADYAGVALGADVARTLGAGAVPTPVPPVQPIGDPTGGARGSLALTGTPSPVPTFVGLLLLAGAGLLLLRRRHPRARREARGRGAP